MKKPATIKIHEFREEIISTINNSGLPWWKVKDELEFFVLPQVRQCAMQEEQAERQEYQKMLEEEEKQKLEELRENRVAENGEKEIEENKVSEREVDNNG